MKISDCSSRLEQCDLCLQELPIPENLSLYNTKCFALRGGIFHRLIRVPRRSLKSDSRNIQFLLESKLNDRSRIVFSVKHYYNISTRST